LYSAEEIIVDPREAMEMLPVYLENELGVQFNWGKAITEVHSGYIGMDGQKIRADQIFICSGSDFETLYPEAFSLFAMTKMQVTDDEDRRRRVAENRSRSVAGFL
jgi:hypothetical protein